LTLKNKANIAFFVALITLGIIGWFSIQRNRSSEEKEHSVSHVRDILKASELLRSHIYDAAVARRAYTLWGDSTQIDTFNFASKSGIEDFATLRKLKQEDAAEESSLSQLESLLTARLTLLKASVELHQRTHDDRKQQDAFSDLSAKSSAQFTELLDVFDRGERDLLQQRSRAAQASYQRGVRTNTFLGVSVFLFLIFTLGLLNGELSRREQAERSAAEQKELLQSILDSCSDAVIVADTSGKIIMRNPAGVR
jgi:CHASE3 domain sensor protein